MIIVNVMTLNLYMFLRVATLSLTSGVTPLIRTQTAQNSQKAYTRCLYVPPGG